MGGKEQQSSQGSNAKAGDAVAAAAANGSDPRTTALGHLGITIGSKNLKSLRRDEVDDAFTAQFLASALL